MARPVIITLTGPSCAGKTTLESDLVAAGYVKLISHTTRAPRSMEEHGVDYFFVSEDQFLDTQMIEVVRFGDALYGISEAQVLDAFAAGSPAVLVCEPNGAKQVSMWAKNNEVFHYPVFITASPATIAERFIRRVAAELQTAKTEAALTPHAKRLTQMLSTELSWKDSGLWKATFEYNEETSRKVREELLVVGAEKVGNWHWMTDAGQNLLSV